MGSGIGELMKNQKLAVGLWFVCCWWLVMVTQVSSASAQRFWKLPIHESTSIDHHLHQTVIVDNHEWWFLNPKGNSSYSHVWPEMEFGWRVVAGTIIGFFGAALGSIGGVGGGGFFVPMLTLFIGFDPKSSITISKCMIMGAAGSTVYYNLRLRHPTKDLPIIDYDLALLFQPMLMLGISIGVAFNVIFADWMVTVLLIILFIATSTRAFLKGIETWKKETIMKKKAARFEKAARFGIETDDPVEEYKPLPSGPPAIKVEKVSVMDNVLWREFSALLFVWVAFLAVQIVKTHAVTCSTEYWILNSLQVPIAVSVTLLEYKDRDESRSVDIRINRPRYMKILFILILDRVLGK